MLGSSKISYYAEENDREFFAEAIRLYFFEPQLLQMILRDTFDVFYFAVSS